MDEKGYTINYTSITDASKVTGITTFRISKSLKNNKWVDGYKFHRLINVPNYHFSHPLLSNTKSGLEKIKLGAGQLDYVLRKYGENFDHSKVLSDIRKVKTICQRLLRKYKRVSEIIK